MYQVQHVQKYKNNFSDIWLPKFPQYLSDIFNDNSPCTEISDDEFMEKVKSLDFDLELHYFSDNSEDVTTDEICETAMKNLIDFDNCKDYFKEKYCFDLEEISSEKNENTTIYAMSAYYWNFWSFLNISEHSGIHLDEIEHKIEQVCNQPLEGGNGPTDCFQMQYILNLLQQGYGIKVCVFSSHDK